MSNLNHKVGVKFTNISEKTLVCSWDGTEYVIEPGETMSCPLFLAKHFAKHLVNLISSEPISMVEDENGVPKDKRRRDFYQKMISAPLFEGVNDVDFNVKMMNQNKEQVSVVRHNSETNENVPHDDTKATGYASEAKVEPVREPLEAFSTKEDEFEGLEDEEPKVEAKPKVTKSTKKPANEVIEPETTK